MKQISQPPRACLIHPGNLGCVMFEFAASLSPLASSREHDCVMLWLINESPFTHFRSPSRVALYVALISSANWVGRRKRAMVTLCK